MNPLQTNITMIFKFLIFISTQDVILFISNLFFELAEVSSNYPILRHNFLLLLILLLEIITAI